MIFRNLLGTVMNRIADLSPVKNLIKYCLDRTLNQFLSDQIKIQDFKDVENGKMLLLTNIALNTQKINRGPLLSSPYILHTGTLGKLKITLPPWSQLASKSIELTAQGLVLDMKPNKKFAENFKETMKEEQENIIIEQMEEPGEISQNSPLDFFRQLVKQMLLNMVIKFQNVAIRLFINQPSPNTSAKPQYYLMFRVPLLTLGKAEEAPPSQQNVEVVRFDAVLSQLSVHLLREGVKYPEYASEKASPEDFPFGYPSLSHPGTLVVMGKPDMSKDEASKLRLTLTTNYINQKKQMNIQGKIGSIELTIDPIQLKILSRFIIQLQQFQKVFKSVMVELGLMSIDVLGVSRQSIDFTMSRSNSKQKNHKSSAISLFASMVMNIDQGKASPNPIDIYSSIAGKPELKFAAEEFNQEAQRELKEAGQKIPEEGYKNINFKQELKLSFSLGRIYLNLLKYVSPVPYQRGWSIDHKGMHVNVSLGCGHFRGQMRELSYNFATTDNKHEVKMKYVTIHDVRLPNHATVHNQISASSDEFFQIDSSTFYNEHVNQDYFTNQPELLEFKLSNQQHLCMEELLRVSDGACPSPSTQSLRHYAFMPHHKQGKGEGLSVVFNSHKKVLKIEVKEVAVMANFEIWKDVLNIVYPIFLYKQLVSKTTLNGEAISYQEGYEEQMRINPFESAYIFTGNMIEEVQRREQPFGVIVEVDLVYCLFRQNSVLHPEQNLISQVQNKVFDYDNFSKGCFCNLTERALYAQLHSFSFEKERDNFNMELEEVKIGFLSLKNSIPSEDIEAFLIVDKARIQQSKSGLNAIKTRVYLPSVNFNIELQQLITFIDIVKKVIGTVENLINFKKNLSSKIVCIDMESGTITKHSKEKGKKQRILEVFAEEIRLKTILCTTCIRSLFFKKEGHNQQIKINALGLGLIKNISTSIGQFRNNIMLTTYPHIQTFSGIDDTSLIFELGRSAKTISRASFHSDQKASKLIRKLQFFDMVNKAHFSLCVFLMQKTSTYKQMNEQKQFFFTKYKKNINKSSNIIIDEEKQSKNIELLLGCPINIYLGNATFLVRQKQTIEAIVTRVTTVLDQIKANSKEIMPDRKDSVESVSEDDAQISIKIKGGYLLLDLRPEFSYDENKNERVLANTRLIVQINLNKLFVTLYPGSNQVIFDSSANTEILFLHHEDRDLETNPVFVSYQQLKELGFRSISRVGELELKGQFIGKNSETVVELFVDDVSLNLCISSVPALQLLWEHFLKHNIAGDFGIPDQYFEVLNEQVEQIEIINEEEIEELEKLIQRKKTIQNEFQKSQFAILKQSCFKGIFLKKVVVARISMSFNAGHQFNFVTCNSLYQSKSTVRTRQVDPDVAKSDAISIIIEKLLIQGALSEQTKTMIEFQRLTMDYSFKRVEGLIKKDQKAYNIPLLRIQRPLRTLLYLSSDSLRVKINHLEATAGFTDQIFTLTDIFSIEGERIEKSGWKRTYLQQKREASNRLILVMVPVGQFQEKSSKITVNAELKGNKILTDRVLRIKKLIFHEPECNTARISQIIKEWVIDILKDNMGTLVTGAFSEVICRCVELFFGAIQHMFGFFIPQIRT